MIEDIKEFYGLSCTINTTEDCNLRCKYCLKNTMTNEQLSTEISDDVLDYLKFTPVNVQEEDRYPYDEMNVWPHLQYLPEIIKNKKFFIPNENATSSYEKFLNEQYKKEQNTFKTKNIREAKKLYGKKK